MMGEFGAPNPLKERLKRGEVVVGTMFVAVHSPGIGHLVRNAGFDFLILDTCLLYTSPSPRDRG